MINSALQKAIGILQIQDVYLRDTVVRCVDDFDPKYHSSYDTLTFQTRHFVKQSLVVECDNAQRLLRVFVDVGARWVEERAGHDEPIIKVFIEAEFVAEYLMPEPLDQTSIDEFSLNNVSYHVWPYWREFLNSICTRMHLPRAVLPTIQLAQNRK
jgi:hypothetical protein